MKIATISTCIIASLMLVSCSTNYIIPQSSETATIYFQDGPTLAIYAKVYRDPYKCTYAEQINSAFKAAYRKPLETTGPHKIEAGKLQTINIIAMNPTGHYITTCNLTFTTTYAPKHSYLIKLVERGNACTVQVFDVKASNGTITEQSSAVDVRFREYTEPFTMGRPACSDKLDLGQGH